MLSLQSFPSDSRQKCLASIRTAPLRRRPQRHLPAATHTVNSRIHPHLAVAALGQVVAVGAAAMLRVPAGLNMDLFMAAILSKTIHRTMLPRMVSSRRMVTGAEALLHTAALLCLKATITQTTLRPTATHHSHRLRTRPRHTTLAASVPRTTQHITRPPRSILLSNGAIATLMATQTEAVAEVIPVTEVVTDPIPPHLHYV